MARLTRRSKAFVETYTREMGRALETVTLAESVVEAALRDTGLDIHAIDSRAKSVESLRAKFRRKRYIDPANDVTDLIGIRVVTYYRSDVDAVVARLRAELEIDSMRSVDKRAQWGPRSFGYRSVHLIARIKPPRTGISDYSRLAGKWFEIHGLVPESETNVAVETHYAARVHDALNEIITLHPIFMRDAIGEIQEVGRRPKCAFFQLPMIL